MKTVERQVVSNVATNYEAELHRFDDYIHIPTTESDFGYSFHSKDSKLHTHQGFAEFTLIVHGRWENLYNGRRFLMEQGGVVFLGADTTHEWKLLDPTGNHFTFFFRQEYFERFCKMYFPEHKDLPGMRYRQVALPTSVANFLLDEAEKMIRTRASTTHTEQFRNYLHNLIYFTFLNERVESKPAAHTHGAHLKVHLDRFEWMNLSIKEIYSVFPVSKSTLIKEFKEETGMTIVEYRNQKRMEYAAQLLKEWDCTIAEVASKVGISSLSYFSRHFKEQYGVLPKEYRNYHCW